jgi:hypothetical protein
MGKPFGDRLFGSDNIIDPLEDISQFKRILYYPFP